MSWQTELVPILRHVIDDTCIDKYSDNRLEELLLVSAQLMLSEYSFQNNYQVDISEEILTPDPTDSPKDSIFIGLLILKAACIITRGEAKSAAIREGIKISDKMGSISITGRSKAYLEAAKSFCDAYQRAKLEYAINNVNGIRAIFNVVIGPNIVTDWGFSTPQALEGEYFN